MSLSGKRILLGVSGGIAVYKIPELLSRLRKAGAETRVVMTEGAARFVTPLTFQTMSGHAVYTDLFAESEGMIPHIDLTREADLFLLAPATANILAKMANGIADDLLSATALAAHCPVMVAPCFPEESLVKKRTGSRRSLVGPAETKIRFPERSFSVKALSMERKREAASGIRPSPSS